MDQVDQDQARSTFISYVDAYDASNPRIALKVAHTLRVASLCQRLASELGLSQSDVTRAWLIGLLHDIGRFEQVRRFDTFNDAASVSHAALGAELLFESPAGSTPLIRSFCLDDTEDELIRTAIAHHSDYRLPEGLDQRTRLFCDLLRDADKIDILKVNAICPIEDIYGVREQDMRASALSPACIELFYQHRCLPRDVRQFPADIMLGHICFVWELVFPQSLAIVREQGYLHEMLTRRWDDPATQASFDAMAAHAHEELDV